MNDYPYFGVVCDSEGVDIYKEGDSAYKVWELLNIELERDSNSKLIGIANIETGVLVMVGEDYVGKEEEAQRRISDVYSRVKNNMQ